MPIISLEATEKTPGVHFDPEKGVFELSGCSVHENAHAFYKPLLLSMAVYVREPARSTEVRIALSYFNSSSAKYILDLLKLLDEAYVSGASKVVLHWMYDRDDLDMEEAGQDYSELLDMPVEVQVNPAT